MSKESTDLVKKTIIQQYKKVTFNQDKWLGSTTFGSGGVCYALCYVWISMGGDQAGSKAFITSAKTTEGREVIMALKLHQHTNHAAFHDYLKDHGHTAFGGRDLRQWGTHPQLAKAEIAAALRSPGRYVFGLANANKTEGHAIAIDTFSNTLFDPNYGIFEAPSAEGLIALFDALLAKYYPDLTTSGSWIGWDKFLHLGK